MKSLFALLVVVFVYTAQASALFAFDVPSFTSCLNPQGDIKANYETGTHGIVGSGATFSGKDTVYTISDNALTQCFCAVDGNGIQTNWWKVSSLTDSEINVLKSQDWVYVANGALWGLEQVPYLALNSDYTCKSSGGGGGGTGDSGSSSNGSSNASSGGSVAGVSAGVGQVLGLASTGNSKFFYGVLLISPISLLVGLFLKKRAKNFSN